MIKLLNSIIVLWSVHPYFRGITLIMVGSWLILILFTGTKSSPTTNSTGTANNQTITNSSYNSGAPTPPIPAGRSINNIQNSPSTIKVSPSESIGNATFEKSDKKDNFATIKEKK